MTTTHPSTRPSLRWAWRLTLVAATIATGAFAVSLLRMSDGSAVITDLSCRNAAVAVADADGDRWVVEELLPVTWQHRSRIDGTITEVDGVTVFSAEGQTLPVRPYVGSATKCFSWAVRGPEAATALLDRPADT